MGVVCSSDGAVSHRKEVGRRQTEVTQSIRSQYPLHTEDTRHPHDEDERITDREAITFTLIDSGTRRTGARGSHPSDRNSHHNPTTSTRIIGAIPTTGTSFVEVAEQSPALPGIVIPYEGHRHHDATDDDPVPFVMAASPSPPHVVGEIGILNNPLSAEDASVIAPPIPSPRFQGNIHSNISSLGSHRELAHHATAGGSASLRVVPVSGGVRRSSFSEGGLQASINDSTHEFPLCAYNVLLDTPCSGGALRSPSQREFMAFPCMDHNATVGGSVHAGGLPLPGQTSEQRTVAASRVRRAQGSISTSHLAAFPLLGVGDRSPLLRQGFSYDDEIAPSPSGGAAGNSSVGSSRARAVVFEVAQRQLEGLECGSNSSGYGLATYDRIATHSFSLPVNSHHQHRLPVHLLHQSSALHSTLSGKSSSQMTGGAQSTGHQSMLSSLCLTEGAARLVDAADLTPSANPPLQSSSVDNSMDVLDPTTASVVPRQRRVHNNQLGSALQGQRLQQPVVLLQAANPLEGSSGVEMARMMQMPCLEHSGWAVVPPVQLGVEGRAPMQFLANDNTDWAACAPQPTFSQQSVLSTDAHAVRGGGANSNVLGASGLNAVGYCLHETLLLDAHEPTGRKHDSGSVDGRNPYVTSAATFESTTSGEPSNSNGKTTTASSSSGTLISSRSS